MKWRLVFLLFFWFIFTRTVFGQTSTIKINEFLIDPTPQIVELFNPGVEIVDLSDWYLDDSGGTTFVTIPAGTELYPNACISITGSFNLNRTSEDTVRLFNSRAPPTSTSAELIDSFAYKSSSGSGISFQRIPDGSNIWATGSANFDLNNLTGLSCKVLPTPTPIPTSTPIPTTTLTTPTPLPTSVQVIPPSEIKNVFLSEVYPYPNANETEWVELYNDNEFSVSLIDWKIDDVVDGGSSPKKFSLTIPGYTYVAFDLSSGVFNNTGDEVSLSNGKDEVIETFTYENAEKGLSFGRISFKASGYCMQEPTKGAMNKVCKTSSTNTVTTYTSSSSTGNFSPDMAQKVDQSNLLPVVRDRLQLVRPTEFHHQPGTADPEVLGIADELSDKTRDDKTIADERKVYAKSLVLLSAVGSFLTAGLIFIRIIL